MQVIIVETRDGQIVKAFVKDHATGLYNSMREILTNLTLLDESDTIRIFVEKLDKQVDRS